MYTYTTILTLIIYITFPILSIISKLTKPLNVLSLFHYSTSVVHISDSHRSHCYIDNLHTFECIQILRFYKKSFKITDHLVK